MKCAPFRNKLFRFREVILIFHQSVNIDHDATSGGNGDAFDGARFVALPPKPSEKSGQNKSTQWWWNLASYVCQFRSFVRLSPITELKVLVLEVASWCWWWWSLLYSAIRRSLTDSLHSCRTWLWTRPTLTYRAAIPPPPPQASDFILFFWFFSHLHDKNEEGIIIIINNTKSNIKDGNSIVYSASSHVITTTSIITMLLKGR